VERGDVLSNEGLEPAAAGGAVDRVGRGGQVALEALEFGLVGGDFGLNLIELRAEVCRGS
jgi:hypothetical protein